MNYRKHLWIVLFLILVANFPTIVEGAKVQLIWKLSEDALISQYGIYWSEHNDSTFNLIGTVNHPDSTYIDDTIRSNTTYYYTVTSISSYGAESGFSNIVNINTGATPVELSTFAARAEGSNAILEWSTASESNNYGFEIQRSKNIGGDFKRVGFEKGRGTTSKLNSYHFVDRDLPQGTYLYRLKQIDYDGTYEFSNNAEVTIGQPREFKLYQNYPNPFNPTTTISYSLPRSGHVELTIFNINGKLINKIVDHFQQAGDYKEIWDGTSFSGKKVASGEYFIKLATDKNVAFKKIMLQK